jgi:guanosine-3',5'-bis(diphosphate) 3'-pyrophosphohydrolase
MKSINVSSDSGVFEGIVTLYVSDLRHLDQIMEKLKRVQGIRTAHRFE